MYNAVALRTYSFFLCISLYSGSVFPEVYLLVLWTNSHLVQLTRLLFLLFSTSLSSTLIFINPPFYPTWIIILDICHIYFQSFFTLNICTLALNVLLSTIWGAFYKPGGKADFSLSLSSTCLSISSKCRHFLAKTHGRI